MRRFVFAGALAGLLAAGLYAAEPQDSAVKWIQNLGGDVVRDKAGSVVEVSLARTWATDNDIDRVLQLPTIKKLDLSLTYVSDTGLEKLNKLANLEDLNLYAAEFITDAGLSSLRANKSLKRLNLRGTDVTDTTVEYLATLTGLQWLDISETQISDVGLDHLAPLSQLEYLNLGGNKISGVSLNVLKLLPKLKTLRFDGTQRRNAGACWGPVVTDQELDIVSLLSNLEELNIGWGMGIGEDDPAMKGRVGGESSCHMVGGIRVTDLGLAKLLKLKHLKRLDISGSAVTAAGLRSLHDMPQLESLSAWNIPALDDTAAAELATLPNLTTLDLSYTPVTDAALKQLAKAPKLQRLYLTDTKVTPSGLDAFHAAKSDCMISWAVRPTPPPTAAKAAAPAKKAASDQEDANEP